MWYNTTKQKDAKMDYVAVKNTKKDAVTFPCLREGGATGQLYLFQTREGLGIGLRGGCSYFYNTQPWMGTVTITQD